MRILDGYMLRENLLTFVITLVVFTFVISIGAIFEIVDLLARGVPWRPVLMVLLWGFPGALTFSIPMSVLTASLLVFGKLSADGEVGAMRACGLNFWSAMRMPLMLALLMAGVCLYVNDSLSPRSHEACRRIIATLGVDTPMEALDEGRFVDDFPEMSIYVGKKKDGRVYNVRIYDMRRSRMKREITAKSGVLRAAENGRDLVVDLFDVRIDPFSEDVRGPGYLGRSTVTVYDALRQRAYRRTEKDMAIWELVDGIAGSPERSPWMTSQDVARKRMRYAVEMSKRLCLAASCVTFALLGIPLGVRAHRRESSAGVAISLLLVFNFYLFVIVAEALSGRPETRPDLIVWLPVLLSILLGMLLVRKTNHG